MSLDSNEVLANVIVGLIVAIATWIGAKINKYKSKVDKAEKDLKAAFTKIRELEAKLLKGDKDASQLTREDRHEAPNGELREPNGSSGLVGNK